MSIKAQIGRLKAAKAALISSIRGKGVDVPDVVTVDELPPYVEQIETGGGTGSAPSTFERVMLGQLMRM